jgi:very-short-patch-repair endonuclease
VTWEPTQQEIEEKLIELAYLWGDIEESTEDIPFTTVDEARTRLAEPIRKAFRVEVIFDHNGWNDPCTYYVLSYDVTDKEARRAADTVEGNPTLRTLINRVARPWHSSDNLIVSRVPPGTPVRGQICRRAWEAHPPQPEPSLDDLPEEEAPHAQVGFVKRDVYWLTPIEAKFYDAARESALFFAVQPWIQGTDRRYRPDFMFFYDGKPHVVELDGHEWHKTKEQRGADAERERWFESHGIRVHRFTGSQVHADAAGCVTELLNVLRGAASRP